MSGTILTGQFGKDLLPAAVKYIGMDYATFEPLYPKFVTVKDTDKRYLEDMLMSGLDLPQYKAESQAGMYDAAAGLKPVVKRYEPRVYTLFFSVSREIKDDLQTLDLVKELSMDARKNHEQLRDIQSASIINNGFSSNSISNGADATTLFSTSHAVQTGATYANYLTTPVALSEAGIESASILGQKIINERGRPKHVELETLVTTVDNRFNATRILQSVLRPGVTDNDINANKFLGVIKDVVFDIYLTGTTCWVCTTTAGNGIKMFVRNELELDATDDFDRMVMKFRTMQRLDVGASDPRGLIAGHS